MKAFTAVVEVHARRVLTVQASSQKEAEAIVASWTGTKLAQMGGRVPYGQHLDGSVALLSIEEE